MTSAANTRKSPEPDWIELLRQMSGPADEWGDERGPLWPLLCDVVEAAQGLHELVEMNESVGRCLDSRAESLIAGEKLAALRDEVERDA